jgi:hypothetical protein
MLLLLFVYVYTVFQPDTYVQRGLTYEGLADWESAVKDYSKAILLWGGGRGPDTNPYALTYRGNALAFLGRYIVKVIYVNMWLAAAVSDCSYTCTSSNVVCE